MPWFYNRPTKEKEIDDLIKKMLLSITENDHIDLSDEDQFKIVTRLLGRFKEEKRNKVDDFASQVENINKLLNKLNEK